MRSRKSSWLLALWSVLATLLTLSCESGDDEDAPRAFTEACDACLSRDACSLPWRDCTGDDDCKQYVACVLRAECYAKDIGSGCEEQAGCALETDSEVSLRASLEFENCARTECADVCGFIAP